MANMDSSVRREAGDLIERAEDLVALVNQRLPFLAKTTQEKFKVKLEEVFAGISTEIK